MEKNKEQLINGISAFELSLDETVIQKELEFLYELFRWNDRVNLTAIKNQQEGIEKHLIDSLALLPYIDEMSLLDLGTGAGLPSIPLAIARPQLDIVSVESVGKKANFQKHIRRKLNLKNLTVLNCRVEDLPKNNDYPLVTARAFASIEKILELVSPLMASNGRLLLLRGGQEDTGSRSSVNSLDRYGFEISNEYCYRLPFSKAKRKILEISPR